MFHEATIKFRIKYHKDEKDAKNTAEIVVDFIKEHFEESAIAFIEKPELINITEHGIDCNTCKSCYSEEVIIGDRGDGIETMVKSYCETKKQEIRPINIHYCEDYQSIRR